MGKSSLAVRSNNSEGKKQTSLSTADSYKVEVKDLIGYVTLDPEHTLMAEIGIPPFPTIGNALISSIVNLGCSVKWRHHFPSRTSLGSRNRHSAITNNRRNAYNFRTVLSRQEMSNIKRKLW